MNPSPDDVADLNMEILLFNGKLKSYNFNAIDINSVFYLKEMVESVNLFLSKMTLTECPGSNQTEFNFDFSKNSIRVHRGIECKLCKMQVKASQLKHHVSSPSHLKVCHKYGKTRESSVSAQKRDSESSPATPYPIPPPQQPIRTDSVSSSKNNEYVSPNCLPEYEDSINKKVKKFLENVKIEAFINEKVRFGEDMIYSEAHSKIEKDIQETLKEIYPNVKTHCFGSRIVGLGSSDSDLDIFIDVDNYYNGSSDNTRDLMQTFIKETKKLLEKTGYWRNFDPIERARTPILRAWNDREKIDCDFSFSNGLSHCNTQLIKHLLDLQPLCLRITLFVRSWAKQCDFDGMNSYVITLLVIFYFQTRKLLPSVLKLQENIAPFPITNWQANFAAKSLSQLNLEKNNDLRQHLCGFFDFYGTTFQLGEYLVCPLLGYGVRKVYFDPSVDQIPAEMERYKEYMSTIDIKTADMVTELFAYDKPMVVQDPFELNHNIAKSMRPKTVSKFVKYCRFTANFLKNQKKF